MRGNRSNRNERFLLWLVSGLGANFLRLLGLTWRTHWVHPERYQTLKETYGGVIYAFWHNQMLIPAYTHRRKGVRILISASRDGEYIARTVNRLGFVPIRGSSSRDGIAGLNQLVADGKTRVDLAITPDGPRGPRYRAKIGVALLARQTGLPVIPCGISAARRKELNSWDRFCIPHPFTRLVIIYHEPVLVSPDSSMSALKDCLRTIEHRMVEAQTKAEHYFLPPSSAE